MRWTRLPLGILVLGITMLGVNACEETAPDVPPSIHITQPDDSARISAEIVRILTETSSGCGCNARVEFYIDGTHTYTSYQPFYYFDWNVRGLEGELVIRTRFVVRDRE